MLQNETHTITKSNIMATLLSKIVLPTEPILHKLKVPYLLAYTIDTQSTAVLEIALQTAPRPVLELRSSRCVQAGSRDLTVKSVLASVTLNLPSDALGYKLALLEGIVTLIRDLPHPLTEEESRELLREQIAEDIRIEQREESAWEYENGYYD